MNDQSTQGLHLDLISAAQSGTLPGLFLRRVARTPAAVAYRQYNWNARQWQSYTWSAMGDLVSRWREALTTEDLEPGERVAILLANSVEWVCFDLAALSLGLVVVPLYTTDSPGNIAFILEDSGARLLVVGDLSQWQALDEHRARLTAVRRVLCVAPTPGRGAAPAVRFVSEWLTEKPAGPWTPVAEPDSLATLIYTSGTTGTPKGVMLSHRNILWDAEAVLKIVSAYREDLFLSFLPLSHSFERTVGYYLPMMAGSCVAYARSISDLAEDLVSLRPTVLLSVPRMFERMYARLLHHMGEKGVLARGLFSMAQGVGWQRFAYLQGRGAPPPLHRRLLWPLLRQLVAGKVLERLGGRLRVAVSGGAPLSPTVARCLIGLGAPLIQGYGLTEAAPVVAGNTLADNLPESVGRPLPGIEVKLGANAELLMRAPSIMLGYWRRPADSRAAVDEEGWLHTGDQAEIRDGRIYIRGRLKEVLVLSTGEKVSPGAVELLITQDPLFEQVMVVGEGMPYVAALLVLNPRQWREVALSLGLQPEDPAALRVSPALNACLKRIQRLLTDAPRHAQVRAVHLKLEPWTLADGLLTPTLKLRRAVIAERFQDAIRTLYHGHDVVS